MRVHGGSGGVLAWHKALTQPAFNLNYYEYNKRFSTTQLIHPTATSTMMSDQSFYRAYNPNPNFNHPKIY